MPTLKPNRGELAIKSRWWQANQQNKALGTEAILLMTRGGCLRFVRRLEVR